MPKFKSVKINITRQKRTLF